jgi:glycosyltransferase involved in cell wall biosynthesis
MTEPLVSVICLCYNHERFVEEALQSVLHQTYKNIQLVVVDDASTDKSSNVISTVLRQNPSIQFLQLRQNEGNCKAFNKALKLTKGDFIIDFATDDVMMPDKIERQVAFFQLLRKDYGVVFTDAIYIDSEGEHLRDHFNYLFQKHLIDFIPEGDVYRDVLTTYFIPSPSMMMRREVIEALNGYDEELSYEDFDFWIRSSRICKYAYLNEKLIKIRRKAQSMSSGWYIVGDKQLHSTYLVCRKAISLNKDDGDWNAWERRVRYELRQAVFSENHAEAKLFYNLLLECDKVRMFDRLAMSFDRLHLPLASVRTLYHQLRYQPLR